MDRFVCMAEHKSLLITLLIIFFIISLGDNLHILKPTLCRTWEGRGWKETTDFTDKKNTQ